MIEEYLRSRCGRTIVADPAETARALNLMNMSYLLAGSTSVNPVMFAFSVGLMLAWRVAGYYGLDRYLLPRLGVPGTRR